MRLLTTESQGHREIENEQDPPNAAIIGAAVEVHRQLGPGSASITKELKLKQTA
jgi:hypothetical protein